MSETAAAGTLAGASPGPAAQWRRQLGAGRQALKDDFLSRKVRTKPLLRRHAQLIDRIVKSVWAGLGLRGKAALVATGGYGRGELFPGSDRSEEHTSELQSQR